ncbi:dihydrofolate reductase [Virgibacillus phasianinus]|uniref:Dihydrofolate reductase n=1 Tax=Virgibacillus phasianinus TaxID=2017483 RepID=A0A220U658_9BACI|nr:dihydrofolate reductase [Virgibacillus phasianinus]ASK63386.1 dihydrofolate reductase [Virgibacillus phasianinus]
MISFVVAMDRNRVIGLNNDLPWHLPKDFKFFKEKTTGHTMIMGRKTYDSLGGPLPNRKNVVLTGQDPSYPDDVDVIHDIDTIKKWNEQYGDDELFVIGGAKVFEQVLPFTDRMYITWIDESFEGDTRFPEFSEDDWNLTNREKGEKDEKNPYDYYFLQYDRKK